MSATPCSAAVALAGSCRVMRAFGDEITIHLGAAETGGKFTMFTDITPPGGGPPPHYHSEEDEWFHVLEGRAAFFQDGKWTEVPAGTTVFMPKGTTHAFKNVGETPLKQIIHTAPAGFERFFSRCEAEFNNPGGPRMPEINRIATEHGIFFV